MFRMERCRCLAGGNARGASRPEGRISRWNTLGFGPLCGVTHEAHHMKSKLVASSAICLATFPALAQQGDGTQLQYPVSFFKPAKVEATPERTGQLKAPEGFTVTPFATDPQCPDRQGGR